MKKKINFIQEKETTIMNNNMNNANTVKLMSRKSFACIMTAKEDMQKILDICEGNSVCTSYNNIKAIKALAEKFMADFGNVDPRWTPATAQQAAPAPAVAE